MKHEKNFDGVWVTTNRFNREIYHVHCSVCGYSGNKGLVIGLKKDNGIGSTVEELVNVGLNMTWDIPYSMLDKYDYPLFVTLICPRCRNNKLFWR